MKQADINRFRSVHMNKAIKMAELQETYRERLKKQPNACLSPGNHTNGKCSLLSVIQSLPHRFANKDVYRIDMSSNTLDTVIVYFFDGTQTTLNIYEL